MIWIEKYIRLFSEVSLNVMNLGLLFERVWLSAVERNESVLKRFRWREDVRFHEVTTMSQSVRELLLPKESLCSASASFLLRLSIRYYHICDNCFQVEEFCGMHGICVLSAPSSSLIIEVSFWVVGYKFMLVCVQWQIRLWLAHVAVLWCCLLSLVCQCCVVDNSESLFNVSIFRIKCFLRNWYIFLRFDRGWWRWSQSECLSWDA